MNRFMILWTFMSLPAFQSTLPIYVPTSLNHSYHIYSCATREFWPIDGEQVCTLNYSPSAFSCTRMNDNFRHLGSKSLFIQSKSRYLKQAKPNISVSEFSCGATRYIITMTTGCADRLVQRGNFCTKILVEETNDNDVTSQIIQSRVKSRYEVCDVTCVIYVYFVL